MQINPQKILDEKILIPCSHTQVQQVGIDLTVAGDGIIIPHGRSLNILLNEVVKLPENIYATFTHRSSFNRKGILITGSIYDPGYCGQIGCTIYNMSGEELKLERFERIGQMMFFEANPASKYNGQFQNEHIK